MFDHAAEQLQEFIDGDATEQIKIKKEVFAALTGLMLMEYSDQSIYDSLNDKMNSDYSLNIDVYPRTKEKALDALVSHKLDSKPHEKKKSYDENKSIGYHQDNGEKKSFAQKLKCDRICCCCWSIISSQ
jgi:hypothetical protein